MTLARIMGWDRRDLYQTTLEQRQQYALQRLREFARRFGPEDQKTKELAVAILDAGGRDPYSKRAVRRPMAAVFSPGNADMESVAHFTYAWQDLVAQVAVP